MSIAVYYLQLLPIIREAARRHGYAIGIHGSLERDFDLIAAPWQEIVSSPDVLAIAVKGAVNGVFNENADKEGRTGHRLDNPTRKPHGRLAWSIQIGGGAYLDLSVMPVGS